SVNQMILHGDINCDSAARGEFHRYVGPMGSMALRRKVFRAACLISSTFRSLETFIHPLIPVHALEMFRSSHPSVGSSPRFISSISAGATSPSNGQTAPSSTSHVLDL